MSAAARLADGGLPPLAPVREITLDAGTDIPSAVEGLDGPVIVRGLVSHWPAVAAAAQGPDAIRDYLLGFDRGATAPVTVGPPSIGGRLFYDESFKGANADRGLAQIGEALRRIARHGQEEGGPLVYLASATAEDVLPGFRAQNDLPFGTRDPLASVWIGTKTRIAAHNDLPLNLACVAAGRRIFTLFPPDQLPNLYIGPFEPTPAGRPISLVDFEEPDFGRFPRFKDAIETAQVAELSAGDALFIPSMWYHHVKATGTFNLLVNYWWRTVPRFMGTPQDALNHAMLTIKDMPQAEKEIWRGMFDHYVFGEDEARADHIPEHVRGILSPLDEERARRMRAFLLNRLNR